MDDRPDDRTGSDRDRSARRGDALAWETTDAWTAYSCPGFDIRHEEVRLPDGTETDFDYLTEPPAVVVLPFDESGDVVLIEEWRQAVDRVNRGLPVGTVEEEDPDVDSAARRELREETGYEAETVEPLLTVEPVNGIADSVLHIYVAEGCTPTGKQDLDEDETIRVDTTPYETLLEEILAGDVRDGRATLAVSYYELTRRTGVES